jgi:CheY-like chemotaxis protein
MPKILVVEDNEQNRESISLQLQRRGFEVVTAEDGKIGVAMVETEKPQLVVMDMNMPELDGWEATRQIKASPGNESLPIIALAAPDMEADRERALQVGCTDCHVKPVDFPKLVAQVEKFLQNKAVAAAV